MINFAAPKPKKGAGRPLTQDFRIGSESELRELRLRTEQTLSECYANSASMMSVVRRADLFFQEVQTVDSSVTRDAAFLMWLERKRFKNEISAASAGQYVTYWRVSKIDPVSAYRRAMTRKSRIFESRFNTIHRLMVGAEVFAILGRLQASMWTAVLALQWTLAARYVDLERLYWHHISKTEQGWLFALVGGKTDRAGVGQGLLTPLKGPILNFFTRYAALTSDQESRVFPGLCRTRYNLFLAPLTGLTSHYVRHSALTEIAVLVGELAAKGAARHSEIRSTHAYTPMATWLPTQESRQGLQALQSLAR